MSKEAEILKTDISCHDTHFSKNQANQGGGVMYLRCVGLTEIDS